MSPTINLPESVHSKLQKLGGSLFTVAEVIERLVSDFEQHGNNVSAASPAVITRPTNEVPIRSEPRNIQGITEREPRQRGITVEVDGRRNVGSTVKDLYDQVLRLLVDSDQIQRLRPYVPFRTSRVRYLIALNPVHPRGNKFVSPIQYSGFFMETHKSYATAVSCLSQFLAKAQIKVRVLG